MYRELRQEAPKLLRRGRGLGLVHQVIELFDLSGIFSRLHGETLLREQASRAIKIVISMTEL
jgi:hypothetical protein